MNDFSEKVVELGKTQLRNRTEKLLEEGRDNAGDHLFDAAKYAMRETITPLVPNPTFNVDSIWPDTSPNQLRASVLEWTNGDWYDSLYKVYPQWHDKSWFKHHFGKNVTEKKEKKIMFFKKIWKAINKNHEYVKDKLRRINEQVHGNGVHNPEHPGLNHRVWDLENKIVEEFIDCHTCGCVVRKEIAFRGHDRIESEEVTVTYPLLGARPDSDPKTYREVVYETWYCKLHKKGKFRYGSHLKDKK